MSTFDCSNVQNDLYVDNEGNVKYKNPIIYPVCACIYYYCNRNNIVFLISNYNKITELKKKKNISFRGLGWAQHNQFHWVCSLWHMDPKTLHVAQSQRQATKLKHSHLTGRTVQQRICQSGSSFWAPVSTLQSRLQVLCSRSISASS